MKVRKILSWRAATINPPTSAETGVAIQGVRRVFEQFISFLVLANFLLTSFSPGWLHFERKPLLPLDILEISAGYTETAGYNTEIGSSDLMKMFSKFYSVPTTVDPTYQVPTRGSNSHFFPQ